MINLLYDHNVSVAERHVSDKGLLGDTNPLIVDLYRVPVSLTEWQMRLAYVALSDDERMRFDRMASEVRLRHISARYALRRIMGLRLGVPESEVEFEYGRYGKPRLSSSHRSGTAFSISHSDTQILIAVGENAYIGVDIEKIKSDIDHDLIAENVFSTDELSLYKYLSPEEKLPAFYGAWTMKEAFVKATGMGMSESLQDIEVIFDKSAISVRPRVPDSWSDYPWSIVQLEVGPEYAGALVAAHTYVVIRYPTNPIIGSEMTLHIQGNPCAE